MALDRQDTIMAVRVEHGNEEQDYIHLNNLSDRYELLVLFCSRL